MSKIVPFVLFHFRVIRANLLVAESISFFVIYRLFASLLEYFAVLKAWDLLYAANYMYRCLSKPYVSEEYFQISLAPKQNEFLTGHDTFPCHGVCRRSIYSRYFPNWQQNTNMYNWPIFTYSYHLHKFATAIEQLNFQVITNNSSHNQRAIGPVQQ